MLEGANGEDGVRAKMYWKTHSYIGHLLSRPEARASRILYKMEEEQCNRGLLDTAVRQSLHRRRISGVSQAAVIAQNRQKWRNSRPRTMKTRSPHTLCSSFFFCGGASETPTRYWNNDNTLKGYVRRVCLRGWH